MITRHEVTIRGRRLHYRMAGKGPVVVLFHQSPRSSLDYLSLIKDWSKEFCVIAPDTPGYGYSDPLDKTDPEMADFADIMAEFLAALNIQKAKIYGFHTGASIALMLAYRHPGKCQTVISHGLSALGKAEKEDFLAHYLPDFKPDWSGSHLTWLWSRIRDQALFFPWYRRTDDARFGGVPYTPQQMMMQVMDFLRAGEHYAKAYRAAFELNPMDYLADIKVPLHVMAAPPDPLHEHLSSLKEGLSASVSIAPQSSLEQCYVHAKSLLLTVGGSTSDDVKDVTVIPDEASLIKDDVMPDLTYCPSGSHLIRGWQFIRDRHLFNPWHDQRNETRIAFDDQITPEILADQFLSFLETDPTIQTIINQD